MKFIEKQTRREHLTAQFQAIVVEYRSGDNTFRDFYTLDDNNYYVIGIDCHNAFATIPFQDYSTWEEFIKEEITNLDFEIIEAFTTQKDYEMTIERVR
jgi:hypothetical protein